MTKARIIHLDSDRQQSIQNQESQMLEINQTVTWTSGAQGSDKTKTGVVLGFIPKGQSLKKIYPYIERISSSQKKYDLDISKVDRYLVRVDRRSAKGAELKPHYYTPVANRLDRL